MYSFFFACFVAGTGKAFFLTTEHIAYFVETTKNMNHLLPFSLKIQG